ncbi:peroxiredoxin family protein [Gracilimonas mengyeensis]|uniref:Por secretion system C-terminal sorting domain-containing protein n=1 Tax=Gracilimonas mengyeensis TaxID=1302730 RepID=A0A521F8S3_9BACT|nr:redoxin domain-containing protein [Gracilimonas mengyeensis]SMO92567.1 Por secretion system C-terminal sorting domain-containing protein [Gracilimonas mengyeensis]
MKKAFTILSLFLITQTALMAQVEVGEKAPDFTYNSLDHGEISLSDYEGKVVYLFFFGATCPLCRGAAPTIRDDIHAMFASNPNFVALGIEVWNDPVSAVETFKSDFNLTFPLLLMAKQTSVDYYGKTEYDNSLVVNADGTLIFKSADNSSADNNISEIQQTIEEALSGITTSTEQPENLPNKITLQQNYPNPFNPSTTIRYTLNKPSQVTLKVYNVLGAEVATLVNERQSAGEKTVTWNALSSSGQALPSGLYMYQLKAENQVLTKKMTLIK